MFIRRPVTIAAMCLLSACSSLEGVFEPACIAYEGDRVRLTDGRFEWQKFTDQRSIDEHGNVIDPFPGYPKHGSFAVSDSRVTFVPDDDSRIDDRYLLEHRNRVYLLTWEQSEAFLNGEGMPVCALRLAAERAN